MHEYTHPHYIYVSMYFLCPQRQNGEIREGAVRRGPGTCDPCHEHVTSYMQYSFYIGPLSLFCDTHFVYALSVLSVGVYTSCSIYAERRARNEAIGLRLTRDLPRMRKLIGITAMPERTQNKHIGKVHKLKNVSTL